MLSLWFAGNAGVSGWWMMTWSGKYLLSHQGWSVFSGVGNKSLQNSTLCKGQFKFCIFLCKIHWIDKLHVKLNSKVQLKFCTLYISNVYSRNLHIRGNSPLPEKSKGGIYHGKRVFLTNHAAMYHFSYALWHPSMKILWGIFSKEGRIHPSPFLE